MKYVLQPTYFKIAAYHVQKKTVMGSWHVHVVCILYTYVCYESQPDKVASCFLRTKWEIRGLAKVLPYGPIFAASGGVQGVNGECFAG